MAPTWAGPGLFKDIQASSRSRNTREHIVLLKHDKVLARV